MANKAQTAGMISAGFKAAAGIANLFTGGAAVPDQLGVGDPKGRLAKSL